MNHRHSLYHIQNNVCFICHDSMHFRNMWDWRFSPVSCGLFLFHNLFMVYLTRISLFPHYLALMGTEKSVILDTMTCKKTVVA